MVEQLQPNPKQAIAFVSWLTQGAPLHLERMNSVGSESPMQKSYGRHESDSAEKFVATNNGGEYQRNLYFLPNAEFLSGRRLKDNLSAVRFLHADLDGKDYPGTPDEQLDTIIGLLLDPKVRRKGVPEPSAVIFSGGGYQAFWRLEEPVSVEEAESMNRALLEALQGKGNTHTPAQLMRLPWTVNWLNDKKRQAGREPALSCVIDPVKLTEPPVSYKLEHFGLKLEARSSKGNGKGALTVETTAIDPMPDLAEILPSDPEWVGAIVDGREPSGKSYDSRSELVLAAAIWMVGKGVAPGHAVAILMNPELVISAHVLEQPNGLRCAQRQVARAIAFIAARRGDWPHVTEKGHPVESHPGNIRYALARLGIDARRNQFLAADEVTGANLDDRDLNDRRRLEQR